MVFWVGMAVVSVAVAGILLAGLWRTSGGPVQPDAADQDLRVYRDQLREVERDVARGTVGPADAERLRTEIARRILEADRARTRQIAAAATMPAAARWLGVATVAALPLGAWAIHDRIGAPGYDDLPLAVRLEAAAERMATRPEQTVAETRHTAWLAEAGIVPATPEGDEGQLIARLREIVRNRPDDLEGHRLLASVEAGLGDYPAAARAQSRFVALKGADARADDYFDLAYLMINAAGGYISPQAEAALGAALARQPDHGPALFLYGQMFLDNDRPDLAFRLWRQVLATSEPDTPWVEEVRDRIEIVAAMAGERFSLPPAGASARGPSAEQMAAAMDLPEAERAAMIGGMVEALAARLANDGGSAQDWARLIASYGVLGRRSDAAAIWTEAQTVFAGQPEALAVIRAAAEGAGVGQ